MEAPAIKTREYIEQMLSVFKSDLADFKYRLEWLESNKKTASVRGIQEIENMIQTVKSRIERAEKAILEWQQFLEQFDKAFN